MPQTNDAAENVQSSNPRTLRRKQLASFEAWPASPKREIGIGQRGFSFKADSNEEEKLMREKLQKAGGFTYGVPARRQPSEEKDSPPVTPEAPQPSPRIRRKWSAENPHSPLAEQILEKRLIKMSATSTETIPQQKFECVQKAQNIPVVHSTATILFDLYAKAKNMHPLISQTLGYCETTSETILTPLMTNLEKPLHTVDCAASQGIEYITNSFPIVKKEPQEIIQVTVKPAVDRLQGAKEYGQEKIQTAIKKGQKQADAILDNKPTRIALTGLHNGLKGANDFLNQYYPLDSDKEEDTDEKVTTQLTVEKPKNPTGQAVMVFALLLQINVHIYGVMKQQLTRIHELTMSRLNQLTGVITMMETAKAEGKAGEGLVGRAKELSGSLLHFYSEAAHSVVSKFPTLLTTYFDFVRCEMQQLFDVFAKAETISDIPSNMLTFAKKSVETTQNTMVKMYKLIKGREEETIDKKEE